jgi:hypothetical protein
VVNGTWLERSDVLMKSYLLQNIAIRSGKPSLKGFWQKKDMILLATPKTYKFNAIVDCHEKNPR